MVVWALSSLATQKEVSDREGKARRISYGSSSCLFMSVTTVQYSNHSIYLKGCSALKILEAVGWEKGTLESSIGENLVEDLESGRSVGLVVPSWFCVDSV